MVNNDTSGVPYTDMNGKNVTLDCSEHRIFGNINIFY